MKVPEKSNGGKSFHGPVLPWKVPWIEVHVGVVF